MGRKRYSFQREWPERSITYERKSTTSELWIPAGQCLAVGIGTGVFLFTVSWGFVGQGIKDALTLAIGVSALVSSGAVVWTFSRKVRGGVERIVGIDLDRNGYVGSPPPEAQIALLNANLKGSVSALDQLKDEFSQFVRGCQYDTSVRRWERTLPRHKYTAFRNLLLEGGWAAWEGNDRRSGWKLIASPEEILKSLSSDHPGSDHPGDDSSDD